MRYVCLRVGGLLPRVDLPKKSQQGQIDWLWQFWDLSLISRGVYEAIFLKVCNRVNVPKKIKTVLESSEEAYQGKNRFQEI